MLGSAEVTKLPEQSTDADLVRRAKDGDDAAFAELTHRYFGLAYATAWGRLRNREDAEEIAQESFLRVFLRLGDLRDCSRFGAWLRQTARNLAENFADRERRRAFLAPMIPIDEEALRVADESLRNLLEQSEELRRLEDAIVSLPDAERELILLHYAEQWTLREIARREGANPTTIGRRLKRALALLRERTGVDSVDGLCRLASRPKAQARALALVVTATAMPMASRAALAAAAEIPLPQASAASKAHALLSAIAKLLQNLPSGVITGAASMGKAKAGAGILIGAVVLVGGGMYATKSGVFSPNHGGPAAGSQAAISAAPVASYQLGTARELRIPYGESMVIPLAANPYNLKAVRLKARDNHTLEIQQQFEDGRALDGVIGRVEDGAPAGIAPDLMIDFKMPEPGQTIPAALVMAMAVPGPDGLSVKLESRMSTAYAAPLLALKDAYRKGAFPKAEYVLRRSLLRQQTGMNPTDPELRRRLDAFDAQMPM